MLKAIFFDLDDTLLDAQNPYREAIRATCSEAGLRRAGLDPERLSAVYLEVAREMWLSFDLGQMQESAAELRLRVWAEALRQVGVEDTVLIHELSDYYGAARKASHRLFPDVRATLDRLHRRYHLGVITNGMTEVQREKIARVGLEPYFDTVLISQEVGIPKPDPRIFHMALESVPCEPHEAVMVGDSPDRDIAGARAVGMHALWVLTGRPRDLSPGPSPGRRGGTTSVPGVSPPSPSGGPGTRGVGGGGGIPEAHAILERLEELLPWLEQQTTGSRGS